MQTLILVLLAALIAGILACLVYLIYLCRSIYSCTYGHKLDFWDFLDCWRRSTRILLDRKEKSENSCENTENRDY